MSLKRFGVSLEEDLLEALDKYVQENAFANRSQAIRFLIEKNTAETKWQCNHVVAGTIIIMYDQVKKDITSRISAIHQEYQQVILSSSQYYINKNLDNTITSQENTFSIMKDFNFYKIENISKEKINNNLNKLNEN